MSAVRNDDMLAVGQMARDFFASLRWRDWIHVARKDQDRNIGAHGLVVTVRYFSLRPHATGARLLDDSVVPKRVSRIHLRRFILIDKRHIFRTGNAEVHPVRDEIRDRSIRGYRFLEKRKEVALRGPMDDQGNPGGALAGIHAVAQFLGKDIALNFYGDDSALVWR